MPCPPPALQGNAAPAGPPLRLSKALPIDQGSGLGGVGSSRAVGQAAESILAPVFFFSVFCMLLWADSWVGEFGISVVRVWSEILTFSLVSIPLPTKNIPGIENPLTSPVQHKVQTRVFSCFVQRVSRPAGHNVDVCIAIAWDVCARCCLIGIIRPRDLNDICLRFAGQGRGRECRIW